MTSKLSFPRLVLETIKRHIAIVLIAALTFVIHLITFFLNVQNTLSTVYIEDYTSSYYPVDVPDKERIMEEIFEICSPNLTNGIIALIIGVVLAFDFFRYMHSKRETDFYESLPLRKQTRFFTILCSCIGLFLILCIVTVGIELGIVYGVGYGSTIILQRMLWNLLSMIASFLVGYVSTVLVMVLTGHPIVAFLGFGVLSVYIPIVIGYLFPVYAGTFFETYVQENLNSNLYYFSPATLVYKMTYSWVGWKPEDHLSFIIGSFIFTLIIGACAYLLFLRRPAETAGRAMAFERTNFIVRFLLVIPLSLYAGALLYTISSLASFAWMIFGILFGAFLLHGMMECIFQFDIKALLCKKRQLLISMVFSLAFVFVFMFDLFGYDNYMPKESALKSVSIDTYLFDSHRLNDNTTWQDGLTGEYVDDALNVIHEIRKHSDISSDHIEYQYYNDFTVTYHLKNGSKRTRRYAYYADEMPKGLDELYATEAFKDDYCILYHIDEEDILSVRVSNGPEFRTLSLSQNELKEFYNIYLKEYTELTISKQLQTPAVYELAIEYPAKNNEYTVSNRYLVYECFEETITYIQKLGIDTFHDSPNITITNMEIHDKYGTTPRYINDSSQLQELRKHMILSEFMFENYNNEYIYCDIRYELAGETRYENVLISADKLNLN